MNPDSMQGAAILTIILAFAGYLITFLTSRVSGRRTARLRLVDQRLNEFYGPLYVATVAGNIAYKTLLAKQGKTECHPIGDDEVKKAQDAYAAEVAKMTGVEAKAFGKIYALLKPNQQSKASQAWDLMADMFATSGRGSGRGRTQSRDRN